MFFITIIFSSCCIREKQPFHETYAPVICNHGPQTCESTGESRANESIFFFCFYIEFDELGIPWQCNVKPTRLRGNCHGFTILLSPKCGGHNRELQIKVLITALVTDDWYITIDLFPAYKKRKLGYLNVQTCSMVSTYVSTAWICFIAIICMNTLCK